MKNPSGIAALLCEALNASAAKGAPQIQQMSDALTEALTPNILLTAPADGSAMEAALPGLIAFIRTETLAHPGAEFIPVSTFDDQYVLVIALTALGRPKIEKVLNNTIRIADARSLPSTEFIPEKAMRELIEDFDQAGISFTLEQLRPLIDSKDLAKEIKSCGVDTAVRERAFDIVARALTGLSWPCNGQDMRPFCKRLYLALKRRGIKHQLTS